VKRVVRTIPIVEPSEPEKKTEEEKEVETVEKQMKNCVLKPVSVNVECNRKTETEAHQCCQQQQVQTNITQQQPSQDTNTYQTPVPSSYVYQTPCTSVNPYFPTYQQPYIQQFYQPIQTNYAGYNPYARVEMSPSPTYYIPTNPYQCYIPTYQVPNISAPRTSQPCPDTYFPDGCGVKLPPSPPLSSCDGKEESDEASPASKQTLL
jgi:hypothetical protein